MIPKGEGGNREDNQRQPVHCWTAARGPASSAKAIAMGSDPIIPMTEDGKYSRQFTRRHDQSRPLYMPRDLDEGIGSGKPSSVALEQVHPGEQRFRRDAHAVRHARCLEGEKSEAASIQHPVEPDGRAGAQRAIRVVENPADRLITYCLFSIHRN